MDERTNLADHLMNPELQIFAQELQSNPSLRATRTDFQTVLQDYQLPPEDPLSQPYTDWQEIACLLYTDQIGSLSPNELFEHTPSLEEMLLKASDQSSSTDLDSINPSIHQLTRQPSGRLSRFLFHRTFVLPCFFCHLECHRSSIALTPNWRRKTFWSE